ncbi:MAG: NUDIX hydrolase [Candidatus Micrarchaeota archaeon]|nr:NUDIX hydrolase [Candidatus Micrarchaeota archaeon]
MKDKKFIPAPLYNRIKKLVPICCVDIIIKTDRGVLLGRRANHPERGSIWFVGGKVNYFESLDEAAIRKAKQETGLDVALKGIVDVCTTTWVKGEKRHTINVTYLAVKKGGRLKDDGQHSEFVLLKKIDPKLPPYVKRLLARSGVFSKVKIALKPPSGKQFDL